VSTGQKTNTHGGDFTTAVRAQEWTVEKYGRGQTGTKTVSAQKTSPTYHNSRRPCSKKAGHRQEGTVSPKEKEANKRNARKKTQTKSKKVKHPKKCPNDVKRKGIA